MNNMKKRKSHHKLEERRQTGTMTEDDARRHKSHGIFCTLLRGGWNALCGHESGNKMILQVQLAACSVLSVDRLDDSQNFLRAVLEHGKAESCCQGSPRFDLYGMCCCECKLRDEI